MADKDDKKDPERSGNDTIREGGKSPQAPDGGANAGGGQKGVTDKD